MIALSDLVRGGIEIYYARYHQILQGIARGGGRELAALLLGDATRRLIEPMPGVGLFLATAKGLLNGEIAGLVLDHLGIAPTGRERYLAAADRFAREPAKIAIVTSSIRYEAEIVLGELFNVLREQVADWPLPQAARERLRELFAGPAACYDAIITASDSSEIRLKPHRDLYSIALHRLGLLPDHFGEVLGLEDSESGVIAIRAAGVGLAVAVPFAQTLGHNLEAAARVNADGLPQVMLEDGFFIA
jgi:hypothetical protein